MIDEFHVLPKELTYPDVTPILFEKAREMAAEKEMLKIIK